MITVKGPSENVPKVIAKIHELVEGGGKDMTIVEIKVDPKHHRYLVGRGGAVRQKLEHASGARIILPSPKPRVRASVAACFFFFFFALLPLWFYRLSLLLIMSRGLEVS